MDMKAHYQRHELLNQCFYVIINLALIYLYYLNLASNPLDQALEVAYNIKNFVHEQYKLRVIKYKLLEEFKNLYKTTLIFN